MTERATFRSEPFRYIRAAVCWWIIVCLWPARYLSHPLAMAMAPHAGDWAYRYDGEHQPREVADE